MQRFKDWEKRPDVIIERNWISNTAIARWVYNLGVELGDGMDDELAGASSVGLHTLQARWFLRSQSDSSPGGNSLPGLQSIEDVLAIA